MDSKTTHHFADIIRQAQILFENVEYVIDTTPERSILRLQATYGHYQVVITELFSDNVRKYRYYVLRGDWIEAGFDNSPDPRALRLKYGRIGQHAGEYIPHLHQHNKTQISLTEESTFSSFVDWLQSHIQLSERE